MEEQKSANFLSRGTKKRKEEEEEAQKKIIFGDNTDSAASLPGSVDGVRMYCVYYAPYLIACLQVSKLSPLPACLLLLAPALAPDPAPVRWVSACSKAHAY